MGFRSSPCLNCFFEFFDGVLLLYPIVASTQNPRSRSRRFFVSFFALLPYIFMTYFFRCIVALVLCSIQILHLCIIQIIRVSTEYYSNSSVAWTSIIAFVTALDLSWPIPFQIFHYCNLRDLLSPNPRSFSHSFLRSYGIICNLYHILSHASGMRFVKCIFHLVQTDHSIGSSIGFSVGTSWCRTSTYSLVHSCSVIATPQIFSQFRNLHIHFISSSNRSKLYSSLSHL